MGAGSLKFEIIDKIGHGQFSTVYRAKWINPPDLTMSAPLPSEAYYHSGTATFINAQVQRQQREQEQQHHHHHHHQQQQHPIGRPVAREANALGNHNHFIDLSGQHNNNQHQSQMNENHSNNNNNNTHHHHQYQNSSSFNNDTNNNNGNNTNLKRNERFVALKRIKFYDIQNSKARMDYLKEVNLLQQVKHPNIINFNISFIERNELYIVLELADGGDLSKLIRYFQKKKRLIPEQSILKYFTQVCSAVEYIHSKRILHRDIKPANIFMTSNGCVKLGDFGLGRFFSQNTRDAHSIVGTFYYMSPERIQESGYSFSSDVWSLGCVLYELITLNSPFSILNHEQHINDANYYDAQAPTQQQQQQQQQQNNPYNLQWLIDRIIRAEYPSLDGYTNISPRLRHLANECLNPVQEARPNMQYVCAVVNETYQLFQNSVTPPMTPLI